MKIELAKPEDSEALSHFFSSFPLRGQVDFSIERSQQFFKLYETFSSDYDTYLLRDDQKNIKGCVSLLFKDVIFENKPTKIGYATDLRISRDRESIKNWTAHFLPAIDESCKKRNVDFLLSLIPRTGGEAFNALVRPRTARRDLPRYQLYRKLDVALILGRILRLRPLTTIKIKSCTDNDLEPLADFLKQKAQNASIDLEWTPELLKNFIYRIPLSRLKKFELQKAEKVESLAAWHLGR
ncbi:MAG: hypothetical protein KDD25_01485 [Bdellovibrionales bacterium]|nr:hypothetical protein [Bdellovibrionales bacterium]